MTDLTIVNIYKETAFSIEKAVFFIDKTGVSLKKCKQLHQYIDFLFFYDKIALRGLGKPFSKVTIS